MGKRQIEAFIPKAMEAIEGHDIAEEGTVPSQFNGYISSFGASLRMAGIVPTVLFFQNNGNAEKSREKVVDAIETILGEPLIVDNRPNPRLTRDAVEDAATALKLAVRTFKLSKE